MSTEAPPGTPRPEREPARPPVGAVVVLYHPPDAAVGNVTALLTQCSRVVVVPNSPPGPVEAALREAGCAVLAYEGNGGTATGFNRGIRAVLDGPEEYVLLLDQDSRAPTGMAAALVAASRAGRAAGLPVAAVAPLLEETKNAGRPVDHPPDSDRLTPVETLVSSGTLVHRDVLAAVGLMDERLFIDGVDHEWCLRAAARGLRSYVAADTRLLHDMGDQLVPIGGRRRLLHTNPVRHYYIVRNSLLLLRRPYLPRRWRRQQFARALRRLVFYAVYSEDRARSLRYMARAVADAARNRTGVLDGR